MDALKLHRVILRTLLFDRPALATVLILIIVCGFALGALGPIHGSTGYAILAVAAPAWGLLTASSFRLDDCCESAGALAIPGHYVAARHTQYLLLALLAGVPSIYALLLSRELNGSMFILLGAAIGVLAGRAWVIPGVVAASWVCSKLGFNVWEFAGTAQGALVLLALAIAGYVVWFRTPLQAHARGVWSAAAIADARFETLDDVPIEAVTVASGETTGDPRPEAPSDPRHPAFGDARHEAHARNTLPATALVIEPLLPVGGRVRPESFWGALGHLPERGWHLTAVFTAMWLITFVVMHFYRHGQTDVSAFLASSLIAGALAGCRSLKLEGAWALSSGEQSVLMLTSRWPSRRALKWLVLSSLWNPVPALLGAWLAVAVVGVSCGWLAWTVLGQGAAGLASTAVACFAFLPLFLAQSRIRKDNRLAQAYLVFVGFTGLMMLVLVKSAEGWAFCCELLLGVALFPILAFLLRRPQFPARPDGDVVL